MIFTNSTVVTERMSTDVALKFKDCANVDIFNESTGFAFAFGYDEDCNLMVKAHANSKDEIRQHFNKCGVDYPGKKDYKPQGVRGGYYQH